MNSVILSEFTWLIACSSSRNSLSHVQIGGRDYQHSLDTPVTSYLFSFSTASLICNQIAMRRRQRGVDILLPIKPLHLDGLEWKSPFQMPECRLFCHPPTHTHTSALYITALLLYVVWGTTHQKVFRWHRAEHFLNANNAMYCAWLFNELGSRFHLTNCTNMQTNTSAHRPTQRNYFLHFPEFSTIEIF